MAFTITLVGIVIGIAIYQGVKHYVRKGN